MRSRRSSIEQRNGFLKVENAAVEVAESLLFLSTSLLDGPELDIVPPLRTC